MPKDIQGKSMIKYIFTSMTTLHASMEQIFYCH
uniref:Uncharacterized protein n=1 Tax=Rhizophora mucronata TaxID=61149 RepID=A0A2P2QGV4_RHIMU